MRKGTNFFFVTSKKRQHVYKQPKKQERYPKTKTNPMTPGTIVLSPVYHISLMKILQTMQDLPCVGGDGGILKIILLVEV